MKEPQINTVTPAKAGVIIGSILQTDIFSLMAEFQYFKKLLDSEF